MITHPLGSQHFMLKTAEKALYDKYVEQEHLFERRHNLFCFGLVYGVLNEKISTKSRDDDIVYTTSISDEVSKNIINVVAYLLDDGKKEQNEIIKEILAYADGGLQALHDIYQKNNDFTIPDLIVVSQKLWVERAKKLNNINLA